MSVSRLEERVSDWKGDSRIDDSGRLVRNIALGGVHSRNGYRYLELALQRAVKLYENKPVFLDHADRVPAQPRSTRDLAGSIVNARYVDGRIRADVRVLDTESGRTFLALAEGKTPGVGMSHVVLAQRSADGSVVERIEDVISVDVVVGPATTTTFQESQTDSRAARERVEEAQQTDSLPPASLLNESLVARLEDVLQRCERLLERHERESLEKTADGTIVQERISGGTDASSSQPSDKGLSIASREELEEMLEEAGLPGFSMTEVFRESLMAASNREARLALIEDRRAVVESAGRRRVLSVARTNDLRGQERAAFAQAIRGR